MDPLAPQATPMLYALGPPRKFYAYATEDK